MTKVKLSSFLTKGMIEQIYTGKEFGCRCGCSGRYFEPRTSGFTRAFNKAMKLDPEVSIYDSSEVIDYPVSSKPDPIQAYAISRNHAIQWIDIAFMDCEPAKTITIYLLK